MTLIQCIELLLESTDDTNTAVAVYSFVGPRSLKRSAPELLNLRVSIKPVKDNADCVIQALHEKLDGLKADVEKLIGQSEHSAVVDQFFVSCSEMGQKMKELQSKKRKLEPANSAECSSK